MTIVPETRQQRRARERAERKRSNRRFGIIAGLGAMALAGTASAATITVNSIADTTVAGDTQCTLREALANANGDAETSGGDCVGGSGADVIAFQSGLTGTIQLAQGFLPITDAVSINGPGAAVITISGEDSSQIFNIDAGASTTPVNVSISGLTLTQGTANDGGAIYDDNENLTLDHVVISGNTAINRGGGVYVNVYYNPSVTITNSTISGNTSIGGNGGGLSVYYALYPGNPSIYLKNDTFTGNSAGYDGGGMDIEIGSDNGTVTILNTVVTNNTAGTVTDARGVGGGLRVQGPGEGGALQVTIGDSVISGNVADPMDNAGALGPGNTSNDVGSGGGLYLGGTSGSVTRSTISGNTAASGAGVMVGNYSVSTFENLTITGNQAQNISIDGFGGGVGVGQSNGNGTILNVNETTITNNSAETGGGGIDVAAQGTSVTLYDTIVANNTAPDPDINGTVTSTYSLIESTTGATINGGTGDVTGSDPNLAAPAANGSTIVAGDSGSTQTPLTELPNAGSPVIDTGDPAFTPPPSTDERAAARVVGGRIDMGAVETQPSLSINNVSLAEGNSGTTAFTFDVTLSAPSSQTVTVAYATADGTATIADGDYTAASNTLTFTPGQTTKQVTVNVNGDLKFEANETFTVNLSSPTNATIATGTGTGTIQNDDLQPTISIGNVSQAEGNSGTTNFVFSVDLSNPSSQTITVNFATNNGTATSPSDFFALSGLMQFNPGVTHQTITVGVNGDTACEPDETFTVDLSTPTNATIATGTGTGTIQNDDACNADLSITKALTTAPPYTQGGTATYTITVTNSGPSTATGVTVTDVLPAGTQYVSATPSQGSCSGTSTVTCTLGSLNNGANATIALTVTFTSSGTIINTANVTSTNDANGTNNAASAPAVVNGSAAIPTLDPLALALLAAVLAFLGVAVTKK